MHVVMIRITITGYMGRLLFHASIQSCTIWQSRVRFCTFSFLVLIALCVLECIYNSLCLRCIILFFFVYENMQVRLHWNVMSLLFVYFHYTGPKRKLHHQVLHLRFEPNVESKNTWLVNVYLYMSSMCIVNL